MNNIKFYLFVLVTLLYISCSNENRTSEQKPLSSEFIRSKLIAQIKKQEDEMHKSLELKPSIASFAIQAYTEFTNQFPNDSLSPDFLFKSGEIATATKQYSQALSFYQNITSKYPKYKLVCESLYLQGVLLDNYLNDDAKAKTIYQEVITQYPNSSYANDAKAAINNLGKSDEELIKEFKKKNGEK